MGNAGLQLIVLAAIAIFMILRLRSVLGTRDGFEPGRDGASNSGSTADDHRFEVIEGGVDRDIADHVDIDSEEGQALAEIKATEPGFNVNEFLGGAKQAYEMILMAFEGDDVETLEQFLSEDVFDSFKSVIEDRQSKGLHVEASFVGVRETKLDDVRFDFASKEAEITVQFTGELTSAVKDEKSRIVEGDPNKIKRQKDTWTFARTMGSDDPNWTLVETGG